MCGFGDNAYISIYFPFVDIMFATVCGALNEHSVCTYVEYHSIFLRMPGSSIFSHHMKLQTGLFCKILQVLAPILAHIMIYNLDLEG